MVLGDKLELHNVLYIPTFQYNLLSVSKLVNQFSANVIFTPHSCVLQAPTIQKELLLGKENKGLFLLEKGAAVQQATLKALNLGNNKFSVAFFVKF